MQIFGPDRSAPSVGFSWFCVKPNLKVNTPCVNQKISAHTWHPTKRPISKPSLISNLPILPIPNFVPKEMGKLLAFYQTHLFTHMQIDRGPPGNRQSKMYKSSTIFILAYTIQFTKSRNKTYANTSQGVQLALAGGWLGSNMSGGLWGGVQTTCSKNSTSASSSTPLKRPMQQFT